MPSTGIERFDQLVAGTEKYSIWKSNLRNRGYEVVEKKLASGNPANIVDNVVEIDPDQFRYIDMLHEKRHIFQDMVSMKQTGNTILNQSKNFRKPLINIAENDAYRYEMSLANKYGFSSEYSNYLRGMVGEYSLCAVKSSCEYA